LSHKHKHGAARLALARLALINGQVDACQQHASLLLEDQPDNEDAAIMLAEIMAHQVGLGAMENHHKASLYNWHAYDSNTIDSSCPSKLKAPWHHCTLSAGRVCSPHTRPAQQCSPSRNHPACLLQGHHESAVAHFQKLLERKPCHYAVLVQLLGMLRRAGKLKEADKYLAAAESAAAGAAVGPLTGSAGGPAGGGNSAVADGGLSYCKGLLQK
jgi:tetratricopeptide (TPR) repeat protein